MRLYPIIYDSHYISLLLIAYNKFSPNLDPQTAYSKAILPLLIKAFNRRGLFDHIPAVEIIGNLVITPAEVDFVLPPRNSDSI